MRLFAASSARCSEVMVGAEGSAGAVRYLSLRFSYGFAGHAVWRAKHREHR